MKRIALTGGFGTGKSTVGHLLEDLGIPRVDADLLTHEAMHPQTTAWHEIVTDFGKDVLHPDGTIDRRHLGKIVFQNPAKRKRLEEILHPKVRQAMKDAAEQFEKKGETMVILEIPLLFESGWDRDGKWAAIVVVTADENTQIERAKKKFGLSETEIRLRLKSQLPLAEKIKKADYVIDNSGDIAQTRRQVETVFKKL